MEIISNNHIDKGDWNSRLLNQAEHSIPPYGFAEYLDIVNPRWKMLTNHANAFFPITVGGLLNKKLVRAPFCQQIPFIGFKDIASLQSELLTHFHSGNIGIRAQGNAPNYILSLNKPYEEIKSNFNTNRKRTLKKALKEELTIRLGSSIKKGIEAMNSHGPSKLNKKEASILSEISNLNTKNLKAEYYEVLKDGIVVSHGLFLLSPYRITYMFGVSTPFGQKINAPTALFNQIIEQYANKPYIFDFEGSRIEGVAKFYQSFGAELEPYELWSVK